MRVVSGIQPTGNLHLGNYLGAIRNGSRCRTRREVPVLPRRSPRADRSTWTRRELRANVREMAAALLACGIDPDAVDPVQPGARAGASRACLDPDGTARMGWLNRMTQWKDKAGKNRESA